MHLVASIATWLAMLAPQENGPGPAAPCLTGVARAREVFRAADRDGDGTIHLGEAIRARIPAADFAREDFDADVRLSRDEFVLYYRHLLVSAGRPLARDLDAEAARIQALRRVKKPVPPRGDTSSSSAGSSIPRTTLTTNGPAGSRLNARPGSLPASPSPRAKDEVAPVIGVEERQRQGVASNDSGRLEGDPIVPNSLRDELR